VSRRFDVFPLHVGQATRTSSGTATAGVAVGEYAQGALHVRIVGLGVGGKLKPYLLSSLDNLNYGILATIATLIATGVAIVPVPAGAGPGAWVKGRWVLGGSTAVKFSMSLFMQE
jgi:hypothetical protein